MSLILKELFSIYRLYIIFDKTEIEIDRVRLKYSEISEDGIAHRAS